MNNEVKRKRFRSEIERTGLPYPFLILHCAVFIFQSYFLSAQTPARDQLVGTWIGVHSEWDMGFFCPLPTYVQLDTDSTYHLGMVDGSATKQTSTWAIHGDSVRLDTIHFAPKLIRLQGDLLRIGKNYPMTFRRFKDIPIDSASLYRQLTGHIWQSDSLTIYLYANGKVALENPITKQRTAHFWRLARFGQSIFLVIRGNQYSRDGNYKPLWQISNSAPKQIQAIGWNGRTVATETFQLIGNLAPGDSCRASGFQTCDNCFRPIWNNASLGRSHKVYDIHQLLTQKYQPLCQSGQSGLIRVQLVVNCAGEQGPVDIIGFDDDYCPKTFDLRITTQLWAICRDYIATDSFLQADKRPDTRPQDTFVSLTFRLKDGQLTDILP